MYWAGVTGKKVSPPDRSLANAVRVYHSFTPRRYFCEVLGMLLHVGLDCAGAGPCWVPSFAHPILSGSSMLLQGPPLILCRAPPRPRLLLSHLTPSPWDVRYICGLYGLLRASETLRNVYLPPMCPPGTLMLL